jgi:hypothetical protein
MLVKAVMAAGVSLALMRAFIGPEPERIHPELALGAGFLGVIGFPIAVVVASGSHPIAATLTVAGSVVFMALACWAVRGSDDEGGEEIDEGPVPPIDWEAFDLERDRWDRTPAL